MIAFLLVLLAQTGFVLHQIAFLTDRLGSANAAALALSTTAFGSIVARFALGQVADRLDKRWLSSALFAVQGCAVLALLAVDSRMITYALVMIVGFTIGNVYMMQTLLVADIFGLVVAGHRLRCDQPGRPGRERCRAVRDGLAGGRDRELRDRLLRRCIGDTVVGRHRLVRPPGAGAGRGGVSGRCGGYIGPLADRCGGYIGPLADRCGGYIGPLADRCGG